MSSTTTSRPNGAASKSPYAGKRALSLSLSPAETLALSKEGGATPGVHPLRLRSVQRLLIGGSSSGPRDGFSLCQAIARVDERPSPSSLALFIELNTELTFLSSPATSRPPLASLSWLFWFVHRAAGTKVASATQYEESIKKIGGCSSIESLWTVYSHILPPSALPPVTDILLFSNTLRLPIWEECPNGAK